MDALSLQEPFTTVNTDRFLDVPVGMRAISHTAPLQRLDADVFDALFFPGGYELLWGATYVRNDVNWAANVVESGPLLTGQNPASAPPLAKALTRRPAPRESVDTSSEAWATPVGAVV
jgi:putative intracellular protease/amidase